jgi:hypothetical protein
LKYTALILAALLSFLVSAPAFAATPCIKHAHVSGVADNAAVDISSGEWNECHTVEDASITANKLASAVNAQTGTTYTVLDTDRGKLVTHSNGAAIAVILPQAGAGSAFIDGWFYDVQNRGAGTVTITPATSTIDGAASLALTTGQGTRIFSNGTNYFTQRGMTGGGGGGAGFTDSAGLAATLSDETGSGLAVFNNTPVLTTPSIASFTNAQHAHSNAGGGGQITDAALSAAVGGTKGGTGQTTSTQGDLLFGAAGNAWSKLAKNASATRYLSNTGANNDPAWAQINLANGTTGLLPLASLGTGIPVFEAVEFTESDSNPTCAAGNYTIYADTSETKLKKCQNGVATDLDASGAGDVSAASNFGTDNVVIRSNGTTKGVQHSGVAIDDSDNISTPGTLTTGSGGSPSGSATFSGATSGSAVLGVADIAGSPARINLPTATGSAGAVLVTNGATPQVTSWLLPIKSVWFGAGALSTDGTQCAVPTEVTINSGPKIWTIICADNDGSTIYGSVRMPDSWNAGTITFTHVYIQTAANTGALNGDIAAQCRGNGEVPSSTWGTEVAIDDAAVVGSNSNDMTTSAAVTPAGTCAAGDMLYFRYQIDAAGTTTTAASLHHIGFNMEYGISSLSD